MKKVVKWVNDFFNYKYCAGTDTSPLVTRIVMTTLIIGVAIFMIKNR